MNNFKRLFTAYRSGHLFYRLFSFLFAKILFSLPRTWRARLFRGDKYYCPVCGSHLSSFPPLFRPYHRWCPVCKSLARHRFVWIYFQRAKIPFHRKNLRILHIAPEDAIRDLFYSISKSHYISGDLYDKNAMEKMDICAIDYPENSFDLIFCSHVLEHVDDDRQALREFHRVLSSEGLLMLMVPIFGEKTIQDSSVTDPAERERLFGNLTMFEPMGTTLLILLLARALKSRLFDPVTLPQLKRFASNSLTFKIGSLYAKKVILRLLVTLGKN